MSRRLLSGKGYKHGSTSLLLDSLSASAGIAYSTRKLRSAYAGKALQIQSGTDIGFNGSGDLDTSGLSGTNAVAIWYDQTVNGITATQATGSRQPVIQSSGTLITQNGHVWLQSTQANFSQLNVNASTLSQPYTIAMLFKLDVAGNGQQPLGQFSNSDINFATGFSGIKYFLNCGSANIVGATSVDTNVHTILLDGNGANCKITLDGSVDVTGNAGSNSITASTMGIFNFGTDGKMGEFLFFPSTLSAGDRNLIRSSWQSYWAAP